MSELHSIAYSTSKLDGSSLGWDLQNLGVLNADMCLGVSAIMDETSPFLSSLDSDFSTGYLEDALLEFSERSKRRRLFLNTSTDGRDDDQAKVSNDLIAKRYWNSNCDSWEISENFGSTSHINSLYGGSDELISRSMSKISEQANLMADVKTPEDEISAPETVDSSSSSCKHSAKTKSVFDTQAQIFSTEDMSHSGVEENIYKRKKKEITKVVYPFALVKPGPGMVEGDTTINDINERMLMAPTRPVRHPVGDFACQPACVSADGPGLSGKAVVALTRIHTQGRGTITIIRTKG